MSGHVHLWQAVGWSALAGEFASCRCGASTRDPSVILTVRRWVDLDRRTSFLVWIIG